MPALIRLAIAKGHIFDEVAALLRDAGYRLRMDGRNYRPGISDPELEVKLLKPQNIAKLVELGSHDLAFTGHDWVVETEARVVEVLDTELSPVRLVAAAPRTHGGIEALRARPRLIVASEYERVTRGWLDRNGFRDYVTIRTFGATEVFPPEDADLIVDNAATGQTLRDNGLEILADLLLSSTRMIASVEAMDDPSRRRKIDEIAMLLRSVLDAREKVMLEMNVADDKLDALTRVLPAMKSPTIAKLYGQDGYAVKSAVRRELVPSLVPKLRAAGATDIVEYPLRKVLP